MGGFCAVGSFCENERELLRGVGFCCAVWGAVGLIGNTVMCGGEGKWDRMTLGFVLRFFCVDAGLGRIRQICAGFGSLWNAGADGVWIDRWMD